MKTSKQTKQTKHDITYRNPASCQTIAVIPKGTKVIPASNLPKTDGERYWAKTWEGMSEKAEGWQRGYGFLIDAEDVEDA